MQFTSLWGTAPLRDDDPRFHTREAFLMAAFLVWLSRTVHGKANRALAKPSTLMGMVYGVARDHHLHGRRFDCLHFAKLVVKALNDNYVQVYGSLDPRRREPFSGPLFRRILVAASSGGGAAPLPRYSSLGERILVLPQLSSRFSSFSRWRVPSRGSLFRAERDFLAQASFLGFYVLHH